MSKEEVIEEGGSGLSAALPTILWQRRWFVIIPLVLAIAGGVAACFLISPMYRSEATVLIESQDLPDSVTDTSMSDMVDQRIARARQRVLSRQELIRLIRANSLYEAELRRTPLSKIVDTMRDNTTIVAVSSGPNSGYRRSNTIALTIGFEYSDPVKAQVIAQQYVNRLLEVDASAQIDQAVGAANFLQDQAGTLQAKIAGIERQIGQIKTANGAVLALGAQTTGDVGADAARLDSDIMRLESENALLASTPSVSRADTGVAQAENLLRLLQSRYSDTHPDVVTARAQLDAARRAAASIPPEADPSAGRLAANRMQIGALRSAKAMLLSQSGAARAAQARAPALVAQVEQLEKEADGYRAQYAQIGSRLQSAQIAAKMQTDQKGERLTLADPPVVPDSPTKPNRPVIMVAAIAIGAGIGLGIVLLLELLFRPLRGPAAVMWVFGEAPMAVIADLNHKPGLIVRMIERRTRRRLARA